MPNINQDAKSWQEERSKRFGEAVAARRGVVGLTAVQLSERTKRLGYPMTRSTIARIEGNHRAGKIDLAEVVTLAAALDTAPNLLLFPDLIDGPVRVLPDRTMSSNDAAAWFYGNGYPYPIGVQASAQADGRTEDNNAYYRATVAFRLALQVEYNRVFLAAHMRHPEWPSTEKQLPAFRIQLERAKADARLAKLTVDDGRDLQADIPPAGPLVYDVAFGHGLEIDDDA